MPGRQDDEVAWHARGPAGRGPIGRTLALAAGLGLAVAATTGAFLTDDARYLRLAVLAAAWAFVAAALVAGRWRSEQHAAAGREQELRRDYERELDRHAAARREFEADLASDLRRRAEEALRGELAVLRRDLAELARVRHELTQSGELRAGLASLVDVRAELAGLRHDLERLAELPAVRPEPEPAEPRTAGFSMSARHTTAEPSLAAPPAEPTCSPPTGPVPAETTTGRLRPVPHRRRRTDATAPEPGLRPVELRAADHRVAVPAPPMPSAAQPGSPAPDGHVRVAEILAEHGLSPNGTPRRRRRYREDDEPDDVLARVLGRG